MSVAPTETPAPPQAPPHGRVAEADPRSPHPAAGLRIAYLVNQYPQTSVSFIRREIAGLEAIGCDVERISVRRWSQQLCDEGDAAEAARTTVLLDASLPAFAGDTLRALVGSPGRFFRALSLAWRVGRRSDRGLMRHAFYFAEACALLRRLRSKDRQWIHAHFGTNSATVAMLCRELGGPPYSVTVHGPEEFDRPEALCLREKGARAGFMVAVSEFGRSQLYRWLDYSDWSKAHVVHCGVDEAFLRDPSPQLATSQLVCVARLHEQKGIAILVEAAARLASEGVEFRLSLIGDGPLRTHLEEVIARHGLEGRIELLGWRGGDEVRQRILASRALVLPSFAEGLPVVLMEALGLGRPVVTTRVAGIPELVRDGESGWVVAPGSVDQLTDAIRQALAASPERLEALGRRGAADVRRQHSSTTEAAKLGRIIAERIGSVIE